MASEMKIPDVIWIHPNCYEGLDGNPVCDRRWFVGQVNHDDVKYVRADARRVDPADDPRVLRRATELAIEGVYGSPSNHIVNHYIDQAQRELESEANQ